MELGFHTFSHIRNVCAHIVITEKWLNRKSKQMNYNLIHWLFECNTSSGCNATLPPNGSSCISCDMAHTKKCQDAERNIYGG